MIDQIFSTYINTSEVSKLRRGEIEISQCHNHLKEIYKLAQNAKNLTEGAFDPWKVPGGFDPSGYIKGWAADRAIEILKQHGATSAQVNAAGDISVAGGVKAATTAQVRDAGATIIVAGAAIYGAADPAASAAEITAIAHGK